MPEIHLELPTQLPEPEAANYFGFTRVGREVQLLVGYIDILDMHNRVREEDPLDEPLPVLVTHRFYIGADALKRLRNGAEQMYEAMVRSGHIDEEGVEESANASGDQD